MSQTAINSQKLKVNNYAVVPGDLTVALAAMDAVNGNSFNATGAEILLLQNTDVSAHTVTITSVQDLFGRTDSSLTNYSLAAGAVVAIQMKYLTGWANAGLVTMTTTSALVKAAVLVIQ